jgi:hypothetical protein
MRLDFMDQTGREGYDRTDLDEGAAYAQGLLDDGFVTEPFYGFDLIVFRAWCSAKLREEPTP